MTTPPGGGRGTADGGAAPESAGTGPHAGDGLARYFVLDELIKRIR